MTLNFMLSSHDPCRLRLISNVVKGELLTMVAQGVLLSMGRIMGSYLYMARINFGGIQSEFLL